MLQYTHALYIHTCIQYSCRATEWPFWFGMLLPFSLIYVFNWIMFVVIMASICRHAQGTITNLKANDTNKLQKHFIIAISLAVVFGLGWAFGLAATSLPVKELTLGFQILFSLFVGFQGFLIFLLHGVRNKDARNLWKQWFKTIGGKSPFSSTISSTKSSSAGGLQSLHGTKSSGGMNTVDTSTVGKGHEENIYDEVL